MMKWIDIVLLYMDIYNDIDIYIHIYIETGSSGICFEDKRSGSGDVSQRSCG